MTTRWTRPALAAAVMLAAAVLLAGDLLGDGASGRRPVAVHAVDLLPPRGQWVVDTMRSWNPTGTIIGHPLPTAEQLMLLEAEPDGETSVAWMPDSDTVCALWFVLEFRNADDPPRTPPPTPPVDRDDQNAYVRMTSCTTVSKEPALSDVAGWNAVSDGIGFTLLLTGPDEPVVFAGNPAAGAFGPLHQQLARAADGRTFRLVSYRYLAETWNPDGSEARLCTVSGDRCSRPSLLNAAYRGAAAIRRPPG